MPLMKTACAKLLLPGTQLTWAEEGVTLEALKSVGVMDASVEKMEKEKMINKNKTFK